MVVWGSRCTKNFIFMIYRFKIVGKKKMIEVGWCCRQARPFLIQCPASWAPQQLWILDAVQKRRLETAPFEYGWEVGANVISRSRFMRYMFLMICIDVYTMSSMYAFIQCWWFFQLYKLPMWFIIHDLFADQWYLGSVFHGAWNEWRFRFLNGEVFGGPGASAMKRYFK